MLISIVHSDPQSADDWLAALRAELPQARVRVWRPGAAAGDDVDAADGGDVARDGDVAYAVGWKPPAEFFAAHPRLRAFFSAGAGVDHLLAQPSLPPDLLVVRLEDAGMAEQMADYCVQHVLRVYRRDDDYAAAQRRGEWRELALEPRERFVVGVVGFGVLGRHVARTIAGLGFPVRAYARSDGEERVDGIAVDRGPQRWPAFLGACRVLILLAPLTKQTENLIDARALALLPPGAHLINAARGGLVVDADLLAALDGGRLASATLDVFREEPLPAAHPFWRHPRIRITPHVAAATLVGPSARQVADKIRLLEAGHRPGGVVERGRGY